MVGYGFQIEMKYTAWKMGFRIGEVPIIFADRTEANLQDVGRYLRRSVLRGAGPAVSNDRPEEITIVALPGSVFLLCGR